MIQNVEIKTPGDFLLMLLKRLSDTSLQEIEKKILELENNGFTTYNFVTGFGNDHIPLELFEDLRLFVDIGLVKFVNYQYKLTEQGEKKINGFELPSLAKEAFEKVFLNTELIAKRRNLIIDALHNSRRILTTELEVIDLIPVFGDKEIDNDVRTRYENLIKDAAELLDIVHKGKWLNGKYDKKV